LLALTRSGHGKEKPSGGRVGETSTENDERRGAVRSCQARRGSCGKGAYPGGAQSARPQGGVSGRAGKEEGPVIDTQLYLAIGVAIVLNMLFNGLLIGIMWQHLSGDIREMRGDLRTLTGKVWKAA
jgi:hypothetical protein